MNITEKDGSMSRRAECRHMYENGVCLKCGERKPDMIVAHGKCNGCGIEWKGDDLPLGWHKVNVNAGRGEPIIANFCDDCYSELKAEAELCREDGEKNEADI